MRTLHTIKREKADYTAEWAKWNHIVFNSGMAGGNFYLNGAYAGHNITYREAVIAENPIAYWPLGEQEVTMGFDIFSDVDE